MEPSVIPRSEHIISRKAISPNALRILYKLRHHGFIAYLVGGCVRDLLLGRVPKDFDVVTDATPGQIKRLFRNCRLIGRRFRLAHLHFENEIIEVATFRRSAHATPEEEQDLPIPEHHHMKDTHGMILRDNLFGTPQQDALSRDFTINALFYNIADFSIIDYSGGISDLNQGIIRPIGDPLVRFTEDPVRMLRAVRFAASHSFDIEPAAWEAIRDISHFLSRIDTSRLYEEVQKTFLSGAAAPGFAILDQSGLLSSMFPQLQRWVYARQENKLIVQRNLEYLDQISQSDDRSTAAVLLAALLGPLTEEQSLVLKHEGVPYQAAVIKTCENQIELVRTRMNVPKRISAQFRALLVLQGSLRRIPPKRASVLLQKPEFHDALCYLRMMSRFKKDNLEAVNWWNKYSSSLSKPGLNDSQSEEYSKKRKRRKRHRKRTRSQSHNVEATASGKEA
ncbi:MAG TPA: polynucleotide adenylyltransferase PcnB [Syntrophorhabdaceae bacterium]|nr:polynucleotide adenylyltransferase PcnB [Syntrophorhabdaceae bacterium]